MNKPIPIKRFRNPLWIAAALAITAVVWLLARTPPPGVADGGVGVAIGGPFSLTDQNGRPVTERTFRGRYMLVYFGYATCPDICPLDLQRNVQGLQALARREPAKARRVQPLFITVDPVRDTPGVLKDYVALFDPRLIGLSGTPEQIEGAKRAYRVYAAQRAGSTKADYLVDHTSITYLMDPQGKYMTHFGSDIPAAALGERLGRLIEN